MQLHVSTFPCTDAPLATAREGNPWPETRWCLGRKTGAVLGLGWIVLGPKAETASTAVTELSHHANCTPGSQG